MNDTQGATPIGISTSPQACFFPFPLRATTDSAAETRSLPDTRDKTSTPFFNDARQRNKLDSLRDNRE
jgi:hypothetical protein